MFLQSLFKLGTPDPLRRALEHLDKGEPKAALALLEVAVASDETAVSDTARLYAAEVLLQLGEEALKLPLVARHLLLCPACRAHRRRVSMVDEALRSELRSETPPFFAGRWEEISTRLDLPAPAPVQPPHRHRSGLSGLFVGALATLVFLVTSAWLVDHHPERMRGEVIAEAPGVAVTELSVEGERATVEIESTATDAEDEGALYLWLESDVATPEPLREPR